MANPSGAKGRAAESPIVAYLIMNGWPYAERRRLAGIRDKGDIAGLPGLCIEVKNRTRLDIPGALRETERERLNCNADYGLLIVKPIGVGDTRVREWPVMMPLHQMVRLLHQAGYGDAPQNRGDALDGS